MASLMVAKVVAKAAYRPNVGTECTGRRSGTDASGELSNSRKLVQGYKAYVVAIHFCKSEL